MTENYTTKNVGINTINARIKYFIEQILQVTPYEFSKELHKTRPDWLYKILKNEVEPSPKTLNMIFDKYPDYKVWILTGDEDKEPNKFESKNESSFENLKIDDKLSELYKLTLGKLSMQEKDIMLLDRKLDILRQENEAMRDLHLDMCKEITELKGLIKELINH